MTERVVEAGEGGTDAVGDGGAQVRPRTARGPRWSSRAEPGPELGQRRQQRPVARLGRRAARRGCDDPVARGAGRRRGRRPGCGAGSPRARSVYAAIARQRATMRRPPRPASEALVVGDLEQVGPGSPSSGSTFQASSPVSRAAMSDAIASRRADSVMASPGSLGRARPPASMRLACARSAANRARPCGRGPRASGPRGGRRSAGRRSSSRTAGSPRGRCPSRLAASASRVGVAAGSVMAHATESAAAARAATRCPPRPSADAGAGVDGARRPIAGRIRAARDAVGVSA